MPTGGVLDITATIGDRSVSRAEVLEWEGRRAAAVFKKLGMGAPPDDVAARREALVAKKLELGTRRSNGGSPGRWRWRRGRAG